MKDEFGLHETSFYRSKEKQYFENVRFDALSLLPPVQLDRVLEIGCGTGNTLAWLKQNRKCKWVCGVELFHEAAEEARGKLDEVYEGNIETMELTIEKGSLDAILCLDVLEHLVDPWRIIQRMHMYLRPGGIIIASIPNVRNFRVVLPLLLFGKWEYVDSGILDKSHLRFFVRETAIELMKCSGLLVDKIITTGLEKGSKARLVNALTFSIFRELFVVQFIIRARRPN